MVALAIPNTHPPRTRYPKGVKAPHDKMLMPGKNNAKLGDKIQVSKWQGMTMYQLTLEERKTCPTSCEQWNNCYGNNMPFAHRFDHTDASFYDSLTASIAAASKKHAKNGFVVRLHVLGDFFSADYVDFWLKALTKYGNMRVFGYTHNPFKSAIGQKIHEANIIFPELFQVRFSDSGDTVFSAAVVPAGVSPIPIKGKEIVCPEQLGQTSQCVTCGLCWSQPNRRILFLEH